MFFHLDSGRNFKDVSVGIIFAYRLNLLLWEDPPPHGPEKAPVRSLRTSSSRAWILFIKPILKLVVISWRVDGLFCRGLESPDG